MKRLLCIAILASAVVLSGAPGAGSRIPRGLPHHFGIGVAAHPDATGIDGWMPKTHIPFDYAYQYLAGGVNTGQGWRTWHTNAQFPLQYARHAHRHGFIPVFSYYMLLQSNGPCGSCGEAQRDLAHLNSNAVMAAYYRDFALLMRRLGPQGYGKTAIVHVEPDLSGYAEQAVLQASQCFGFCTGHGNDPSLLKASVKRSGVKDVARYANTYRGFNLALLHLRDLYAPNVLLALHVSDWATLYDVGSQTDPADARALGRKAGTFAARSGVDATPKGTSHYELIFNDVADRDAGYYQQLYGTDVWWDRLNRTLPNFHRWERYIRAVHRRTDRPVVVWQIPLGNQYFRSMNDTDGHYQDNRAEYFFHHVKELRSAGIVALLFGGGAGGTTSYNDTKGDGVTNPPARCNRDGTSGAAICASHRSMFADDDGGYLRMAARNYYRHRVGLG